MICEFRNDLERYICYIIGTDQEIHITKETYLSDVILIIIISIFMTVLITWWLLPLRLLFKIIGILNLNPKFVCSKYKEE